MVDLRGFDAREVEPMDDFEPVPADTYVVAIVRSEMKETKAGNGEYLELEMTILDGPYKGRKLWDRLCLAHPNSVVVKIARARLASVCKATGILTPSDSAELHDIPFAARVAVKKREDNDELTNTIKAYDKKPVPGQAPQAASDSPPWRC